MQTTKPLPTPSPIFTFAVVADAHIRLDTGSHQGDYPSNQQANGRNRHVIQQLNQLAPDLVIHLGDMVHPIPALPTYEPAMRKAYEMYRRLDAPLHVLPGNHDIGDKPNAWTPAPAVTEASHAVFERVWGPAYASFDHKGRHFVLINSPVLNSGLARAAAQRAWLERDLAANQKSGKRVFLFTHYPLYLTHPQEGEHYDNIGRPARGWLLSLLEQYDVVAVFAGHVHNFFYNRYHHTDLYVLPSVAFVRPEFSELFAIEPAAEYGRDDPEKLGFCLVTVDETGHHIQMIRTHGATAGPAEVSAPRPFSLVNNRAKVAAAPVGVFLRHAWAEPVTLSYGNLDEFRRKRARNDYLLWALWELGIRKLRLPLGDLAHDDTRERMRALRALGHEFTLFSVGIPDSQTGEMIGRYRDLIAAWEVIVPWEQMATAGRRIREVKQRANVMTYLSKLESLADQRLPPQPSEISHFPDYGFRLTDEALLATCLTGFGAAGTINGFVFRLTAATHPWEGIRSAQKLAARFDVAVAMYVQLPRQSEGVAYTQDLAISNRIAETVASAASVKDVELFLDTFVDHDRGYYPRHGLLDKRYNPRPGYDVFRHLQNALGDGRTGFKMSRIAAADGIHAFALEAASYRCVLLLSREETESTDISLSWASGANAQDGVGQWLDLRTGQTREVRWQQSFGKLRTGLAGSGQIRIHRPTATARFYPTLFFLT